MRNESNQPINVVNQNEGVTLEICVDTVQSAFAAEAGGASRIELCQSLTEGGTTPSAGLLEVVRNTIAIDIHVLIRPRRSDFLFSNLEFEIMKKDVAMAKQLGANGVVIGILKKDGNVDMERMRALIDFAYPLNTTFHRAFDLVPDPMKALDDIIQLKMDRLLTSGQQKSALEGTELIRELVKRANNTLAIMPGGGIDEHNIAEIMQKTGAREFHTSSSKTIESTMSFRRNNIIMANKRSLSEFEYRVADEEKIKLILEAAKY